MDSKRLKEQTEPIVWGIIGVVLVVAIWHTSVLYTKIGRVLPSPFAVLQSFVTYLFAPMGKYNILQHALFSLSRVFAGFGLSAAVGILLGIGMGYSKTVYAIFDPIFKLIRPIPGLAWIPMAILWFGIGESSKYFIIFMGGFSHVVVNSMDGARRTEKSLVGAAQVLGANRRQLFLHVVLPSSVPYIFAGLQVSLSTSWMAVLAAEMVSSYEGSGWIIVTGMNNGNTVQIMVGMISIGLVGLLLATGMRMLEKELCSWTVRGR